MGPGQRTMKLKPLLSTLREKKRYLAFEVLAEKPLAWHDIKTALREAIALHIGTKGLAEAGLLFVKYNKNKGVLRTSHTTLNSVRAALIFMKEINKQRVIVKSIKASGMLHKAAAYMKNEVELCNQQ